MIAAEIEQPITHGGLHFGRDPRPGQSSGRGEERNLESTGEPKGVQGEFEHQVRLAQDAPRSERPDGIGVQIAVRTGRFLGAPDAP